MDESNNQEQIPLINKTPQKHFNEKRALYLVLSSTLFERIAFYALTNILFTTLQSTEPFHWNSHHSESALFIFSGK